MHTCRCKQHSRATPVIDEQHVDSNPSAERREVKMDVVVIDPGHGGHERVGGSSPNNATGPSGQPRKL